MVYRLELSSKHSRISFTGQLSLGQASLRTFIEHFRTLRLSGSLKLYSAGEEQECGCLESQHSKPMLSLQTGHISISVWPSLTFFSTSKACVLIQLVTWAHFLWTLYIFSKVFSLSTITGSTIQESEYSIHSSVELWVHITCEKKRQENKHSWWWAIPDEP